jgi:hypothetical protein
MARNVEIIEGDVLAIDFDSLFGPKPGLSRPGIDLKPEPVKVVGNLPYYITSDILLRLFEFSKYFDSIVIMVQREVADRIAAQAGRQRLRHALGYRAAVRSGGESVHAAAGSIRASAESTLHGAAADDRPAAGKAGSRGRRLHRFSAAFVWAEAQDAVEQPEVEV